MANIAWQYTSKGRFPKTISNGNSGNFDLNVLYKEPVKKIQRNLLRKRLHTIRAIRENQVQL